MTETPSKTVHPMIPVPEAIRRVLTETARRLLLEHHTEEWEQVVPVSMVQRHCILAQNVIMREPGYPPYTASVMDGYAVASLTAGPDCLVVGKRYAGQAAPQQEFHSSVLPFSDNDKNNNNNNKALEADADTQQQPLPIAYYVTTGAVVPDECDCVVPVEQVEVNNRNNTIHIPNHPHWMVANQFLRRPGCDIAAGQVVLPAGHAVSSMDVGLLRQSGVSHVTVRRKIVVGVLSTGSELVDSANVVEWEQLQKGKIPDINRPVLLSLLSEHHVETIDMGMVRDDSVQAMRDTLQAGLDRCDVIITTGGISMGETDIVEQVLVEQLGGTVHFGRLHMKPGKPTTFVTIGNNKLVFALPGNPVSAVVCTHLLVLPALDLLRRGADTSADTHGANVREQLDRMVENAKVHSETMATLAHDIKLDVERPEYHRVILEQKDKQLYVWTTGPQRSSRFMSLRDAKGLLCLPQATKDHPIAKAGESYPLLLLYEPLVTSLHASKHVGKKKKASLRVGIVQVIPGDAKQDDYSNRVEAALSGSKSGSVHVTGTFDYSDTADHFPDAIQDIKDVDILVIVCPTFTGCLRYHTKLAQTLRSRLDKVADPMAQQACRGCASQFPLSPLFDVVIGYRKPSMIVMVPEQGLDAGLANVRGLLKHALQTARGDGHT